MSLLNLVAYLAQVRVNVTAAAVHTINRDVLKFYVMRAMF
jgi:hypothetical protein